MARNARILVLAYFEPDEVPKLIRAIKATRTPPGTRIYVGSYGVNGPVSRQVQALTRGRYAPMFPIKPTSFWNRRRVAEAEQPRYAGRLPSLNALLRLPSRERLAWGRELGRRFRDEVRQAELEELRVDAWQFDELVAELSGPQGRPWREFTRATLHGLNFGRPEFSDGPRIGFVWASRHGLRVAGRNVDAELRAFWRALHSAAFALVGEEYPPFSGNPEDVAQRYAAEQRLLARGGTIRKELAQRYVVGMTPGWHRASGLGGNVNGWRRSIVNRWRAKYVDERRRIGVHGFGAYHFRFENSSEQVMRDTLAGLARGLGNA
ncbi:MAG TPA: hypothetical protein VG144_13545 [Gaiellaceae bacterium]|nr:hypothetical protein [Gaiellaceae bacterium]